jgi:hypothetical protein
MLAGAGALPVSVNMLINDLCAWASFSLL